MLPDDETKQQQPATATTAVATNTTATMMRQRVDVLRQIIDDHEQCLSALNRAKRTIRLVQKQLLNNDEPAAAATTTRTAAVLLCTTTTTTTTTEDDTEDEEESCTTYTTTNTTEKEKDHSKEPVIAVAPSVAVAVVERIASNHAQQPPNNPNENNSSNICGEEKVSEEELYNNSQHDGGGVGKHLLLQDDEAEINANANATTTGLVDVNQHQDEMLARRLQAEEDNHHHHSRNRNHVQVQVQDAMDHDEMDDIMAAAYNAEDDNSVNVASSGCSGEVIEEELPVVVVDDEALSYRTTEMVGNQHINDADADADEILARALQADEDMQLQAEQQEEDYVCDEDDGERSAIGINDGDRRDADPVDIDADERLARALQAEEDYAAEELEFSGDDYVEESASIIIPDDSVEHLDVIDTAADERLARELQAEEDEESDSALGDVEMHEEIGEDVDNIDEFEEVKYGGEIENKELSTSEGPVETAVLNTDENDDLTNYMKTDEVPRQETLFNEEKVIEADELRSLDNVNEEDMKETTPPIQDVSPSSLEENDDNKSMAVDDAIAEKSAHYQPAQSARSIVDHDQDDLEERITRYFMTQQDEELARRLQAEEEAAVEDDEMQDPPDDNLQYLEAQQFREDGDDNDIDGPSSEKRLESFNEKGREYAESDLGRSYHRRTSDGSISSSDKSVAIRRTRSANESRSNEERALPQKHRDAKFASIPGVRAVSTIHEDEVEDKIGNFNRARLSMPSPPIEPIVEEKKPQGLRKGFDSLIRRSKELRRNRDLIKLEKDDRNILRDLWSMQPEEVPEVKRRSYMNLAGT